MPCFKNNNFFRLLLLTLKFLMWQDHNNWIFHVANKKIKLLALNGGQACIERKENHKTFCVGMTSKFCIFTVHQSIYNCCRKSVKYFVSSFLWQPLMCYQQLASNRRSKREIRNYKAFCWDHSKTKAVQGILNNKATNVLRINYSKHTLTATIFHFLMQNF
jgi:hypothetical protein